MAVNRLHSDVYVFILYDFMTDDWKEKYLLLIEQQDQNQKLYQQRLETLRRGLVQVSLAADGLDRQLDEQSDQLRELLRDKNTPIEPIATALEQIDHEIARVDRLKQTAVQRLRDYLQQIITILSIHTGMNDHVRKLMEAVDNSELKLLQLPDLLVQFTRLNGETDHQDEMNNSPAQIVHQQPSDQQPLLDQIASAIVVNLTHLINQLPVSDKLGPNAEQLMQTLTTHLDWPQLDEVFRQVEELIVQIVGDEQQSFENYLISLSSQLKELGLQLTVTQETQQQQSNIESRLHEKLDAGFSQIQQQLREEGEISSLKVAVQQQLQTIEQAVTEFKTEHLTLEQSLRAQLESLSRQMQVIEASHQAAVQALEQQRSRAMTDALTGLPNRGAWESRISEECDRVKRYGSELVILVADVDHFKRINDSYGHLAGDKVLKILANKMRRHFRQSDFVARYGGEEFVILMPETKVEDACTAANNVRERIERTHFHFKGDPVQITISFGVAQVSKKDTKKSAFERADKALYIAKQTGRNRVETANTTPAR